MVSELGICQATLIGRLVEEPKVTQDDPLVIETKMVAIRRVVTETGERRPYENTFTIRATGTAAKNILNNYFPNKHCYINGEMTVYDGEVVVHAAQLLWQP